MTDDFPCCAPRAATQTPPGELAPAADSRPAAEHTGARPADPSAGMRFCADCPDREACGQGLDCGPVREAAEHLAATGKASASVESAPCLEVTYADHQVGHFPITEGEGWRIDSALRLLVIGRGVPRKIVPLDSVQLIELVRRSR